MTFMLVAIKTSPEYYVCLQARYNFGWNKVFIHSSSGHVDYESLHNPKIQNEQRDLIGIELISLPVSLEVPCEHVRDTGQLCANCDACKYVVSHSFQVPIHQRYVIAAKKFGECANVEENVTLHNGSANIVHVNLSVRESSANSDANFYHVSGEKSVHWLYHKTKLGRLGNYAEYNSNFGNLTHYNGVANFTVPHKHINEISFGYVYEFDQVRTASTLVLVCSTCILTLLLFIKK